MGLTWKKVEASARRQIRGVNVWPYASAMLDESRSRSSTTLPPRCPPVWWPLCSCSPGWRGNAGAWWNSAFPSCPETRASRNRRCTLRLLGLPQNINTCGINLSIANSKTAQIHRLFANELPRIFTAGKNWTSSHKLVLVTVILQPASQSAEHTIIPNKRFIQTSVVKLKRQNKTFNIYINGSACINKFGNRSTAYHASALFCDK